VRIDRIAERPGLRSLGRSVAVLALAATAALLVGAMPIAAAPSSAAAKATTFAFRGALAGKLRIAPGKNCDGAGPRGVTLDNISGKLKGSKATRWSIEITSPGNGRFKLTRRSESDITISGTRAGRTQAQWSFGAAGTLTVHGTHGSVNIQLWSATNQKIRVVGAWNCPA
jgi:hypothetical protein